MSKTGDVRRPIGALLVVDGDITDVQPQPRGSEQQIKVTEWIEIT